MTSPTTFLTEEQVASFHREGYLVLDAITTQEEVARLRLIYDRLFSDKIGWASGNQFDLAGTDEGDQATLPQLLGPSQYAPELKETRYLRNAQGMARQLLGEEMLPRNGEHMIYKPPAIGAATPWHQDQAYHAPMTRPYGVNFWVPLDADKFEIKAAVEDLFKVKVTSVNTLRRKGKVKRFQGRVGTQAATKKAIITLAEGQSIDVMGGV